MFCTENKSTKPEADLDPQIEYDGVFCDNIMSGSHFVLTKHIQLR